MKKKNIYILLALGISIFFVVACAPGKAVWDATWKGSVLGMVNVEYKLSPDSFAMKTESSNGIVIMSAEGSLEVLKEGVFRIRETRRFVFDQDLGVGSWQASKDTYEVNWSINSRGCLVWQTPDAPFPLELSRS